MRWDVIYDKIVARLMIRLMKNIWFLLQYEIWKIRMSCDTRQDNRMIDENILFEN